MVEEVEVENVAIEVATMTLDGKRITKAHFEQFTPLGLDRVDVTENMSFCGELLRGVICTHRHISKQVEREALTNEWGRLDADRAALIRRSMAVRTCWLSVVNGVIYDCHAHLPFDPNYGYEKAAKYSEELLEVLRDVPHILIV
tara:strand:- start:25 stop:456 length:432 start_codon:yes stop_codon:yes gene_type:complete